MAIITQRKNIMPKSKAYVKRNCVYWLNDKGQHHREDGPAWEYADGSKLWFLNGLRHREDGPAIVYSQGLKAWYLNGDQYTEKTYNAKIKTLRLS